LNVRIWRNRDESFGHHLLDPSTGGPAWSGLVGATAIGDSALEAETLSKMALLLGPERARQVLAGHGGVIIHDNGDVEAIGPIDGRIDGKRVPRMVA
jgi:thiamine biosynthesis lipoprotein